MATHGLIAKRLVVAHDVTPLHNLNVSEGDANSFAKKPRQGNKRRSSDGRAAAERQKFEGLAKMEQSAQKQECV